MRSALRAEVEKITGNIQTLRPLSGGDINELFHLETPKGAFVVKTHTAPPPGFFASEALGLNLLRERGMDVPQILAASEAYLLMEYLFPGKPMPEQAGESLARLHAQPQSAYGLAQNTYLATLLQDNSACLNHADFYWDRRIAPLLTKITGGNEIDRWNSFRVRTTALLNSCPFPALLHGDLWTGNLYHSVRGPVFIDPACYAADPLIDIAMTKLFGGFSAAFYGAYHGILPRRDGEEELIRIYQIYPLLVHAHLFGGGYYANAAAIRDSFL